MSKIILKRDIESSLRNMSDDEIFEEFKPRVTLEFEVCGTKYIFRNVDDKFMEYFSVMRFIELLTTGVQWYKYSYFDKVNILGIDFIITDATKRKMVLVRSND